MQTSLPQTTAPSPEERLMAAIAHAMIIVYMIGIVGPLVIWITQKDKSRFVAFQALQALTYQLLVLVIYFFGFACYFCGIFSLVFGGAFIDSRIPGTVNLDMVMTLPVLIMLFLLFFMLASIIYGLVGAVIVLLGKDFRYFLIAPLLESYLARAAQTAP